MSIKIPELSFIGSLENYVSPVANCEGYSSLSYYVITEHDGELIIQTSVDGINFYQQVFVNILSTGTIYQDKINITFKYARVLVNLTLPGTVQLQSFFFEEGDVTVNNYAGSGITTVNGLGPISSSNPSGPSTDISIPKATAVVDGYLAASDFSTFNAKVSSVSASLPILSSGGTTPNISIPQSSAIQDGYLSATDFATFSSKQPGGTYVTSVSGSAPIQSSGGTTPSISLAASGVTPGSYTNLNATISANGIITAASNGAPSGGTVTSVSGSAPLSVTNPTTTPNISMTQATSLVDGYLAATDFATFSAKGNGTVTSIGYVAGTGIGISGTTPVTSTGTWTISNSGVTSLTAGTGVSLSGGTGAITVTNSAPDQTVTLIAGSGISVTGSYPSFTVASTQVAAGSYLISTQAPTALTQNAVIGTTSTNVAKTSDWADNGSGRYTYSGSAPNRFTIQVDFNGTSLTSGTQAFEVIKNGLVSTTAGTMFPIASWTSSGSTTSFTVTQSSNPFGLVSGDYIQLYNTGTTTASGATISIKVTIINVSN